MTAPTLPAQDIKSRIDLSGSLVVPNLDYNVLAVNFSDVVQTTMSTLAGAVPYTSTTGIEMPGRMIPRALGNILPTKLNMTLNIATPTTNSATAYLDYYIIETTDQHALSVYEQLKVMKVGRQVSDHVFYTNSFGVIKKLINPKYIVYKGSIMLPNTFGIDTNNVEINILTRLNRKGRVGGKDDREQKSLHMYVISYSANAYTFRRVDREGEPTFPGPLSVPRLEAIITPPDLTGTIAITANGQIYYK